MRVDVIFAGIAVIASVSKALAVVLKRKAAAVVRGGFLLPLLHDI